MPASPKKRYKCNTCGLTGDVTPFYARRPTECVSCHRRAATQRRRVVPGKIYTCNICTKTSEQTRFFDSLNSRCAACHQQIVRRARDIKPYRPRVFTENDPPRRCRRCSLTSDITPFYPTQAHLCATCHKAAIKKSKEARRAP